MARRSRGGRERALQHIEEARKLSELLGGTDVDVKEYFFGLPEAELSAVLDEYEQQYGTRKREYADFALPRWRSGRRAMSGLVAERLFNLLPPRMPLSTKYQMVRTLWEKYSPRSDTHFVIGPDCDPATATRVIEDQLLDEVTHYTIPEPLENRFAWLASGDVATGQQLLNHFLDEERKLIVSDARNRTQVILQHFEQQGSWTATIKQKYTIGNHTLEIFFDPQASGIREGRPLPKPSTLPRTEGSGCLVMFMAVLTTTWVALSFAFLWR